MRSKLVCASKCKAIFEFHATVRAVITIEMSDTRKLSRQPMDQTRY